MYNWAKTPDEIIQEVLQAKGENMGLANKHEVLSDFIMEHHRQSEFQVWTEINVDSDSPKESA